MNNPNPFVPKGSLLELQSARRSRLKIAVSCILAVGVVSLVGMLIQGCKREQPADNAGVDTNPPVLTDTNPVATDTNPVAATSPLVPGTNTAPIYVPPPVVETAPVPAAGSAYQVVKGDTLGSIAKAHHVSLKDLEAANPGVDSKHLKLKQNINIPAAKSADATPAPGAGTSTSVSSAGGDKYIVKSGDTLTTIAKKHGTTVKALQAANNLATTKIKVGQPLTLPAKAEVAPVEPAPAPAPAPLSVPAPSPTPTTTH